MSGDTGRLAWRLGGSAAAEAEAIAVGSSTTRPAVIAEWIDTATPVQHPLAVYALPEPRFIFLSTLGARSWKPGGAPHVVGDFGHTLKSPFNATALRRNANAKRRRRWQQEKRHDDPDYLGNDSDYYKNWVAKNPDYWKKYRASHPDYADHNRQMQQTRNQKRREAKIAKEDAPGLLSSLSSGRYRLTSISADGIAKEDAWIAEITLLSAGCKDSNA